MDVFLVVQSTGDGLKESERYQNCREEHYAYEWDMFYDEEVIAWMLPEPYKED